MAYPISGPHHGCEPLLGGSCKYSHNVNELGSDKVYNVGMKILNHPWLGMVYTNYLWGVVYYGYTHIIYISKEYAVP